MLITFDTYLTHKFGNGQEFKIAKRNRSFHKEKFVKSISGESFREKFIKRVVKHKQDDFYVFSHNNVSKHDTFEESNYIGFVIVRKLEVEASVVRYVIPILAIHEEVRNSGYGTMMMREIREKITPKKKKKVELFLHSLPGAIRFYERFGFFETIRREYLSPFEDLEETDIVMCYMFQA